VCVCVTFQKYRAKYVFYITRFYILVFPFSILKTKVGYLFASGLTRPFGMMKVNKTLRELDNKIIECRFQDNNWVFMRERTDKSFPNSRTTAQGTVPTLKVPLQSLL
jgi:hypothetical protein